MYSEIKMIEIRSNSITFQKHGELSPTTITSPVDFCFSKASATRTLIYNCCDDITVCISNTFMLINQFEKILLKFYIPFPVRFYIEKDVKTKSVFTLEYRKHLYDEYDKKKHTMVKMNFVENNDAIEQIKKIAENYSTGKHNQPIIVCFLDKGKNNLHFAILRDGLVVESGVTEFEKNKPSKLPNLFMDKIDD